MSDVNILAPLSAHAKHTWQLGDDGSRAYLEQGGFHGGPHCTTCDEYFCEHEPDFDENAECPGASVPCDATSGGWECIYDAGHEGKHRGVKSLDWN